MSNAISGVGTKFYRHDGAAYVAIADINNISGPSMSRETIDVTSLDSVGGYREFIGGIRDAGTVSFGMNFTRSGYIQMKDDFESSIKRQYKIVIPDSDSTTLAFTGLVTELPLTIEVADKITADVTIKISGQVISATGSENISPMTELTVGDVAVGDIEGSTGGEDVVNVLDNTTFNSLPATVADVSVATLVGDSHLTLNADGSIDVLANTPAGSYTLTFAVFETARPDNVKIGIATIGVVVA